jgi:spore coat protein U-like protein
VQTVYGQLVDNAANQNVSPGTYSDTITVTVTF